MEEILDRMETANINTEASNNNNSTSEYSSLYKNSGRLSNQEERRRELLELQRSHRNNNIDRLRGIMELANSVDERNIFRASGRVNYRPSVYVSGFNRVNDSYKDVLMLSEWIVERPEDLEENWYVVTCPKGIRMLVIANQGRTKCFTKYGQYKFQVYTRLPGGNPTNCYKRNTCCVLDCFYNERRNTMYVLDFLAWNNQPMTDCDTEFRDYWLKSQFNENPEFGVVSDKNKIKFVLLPKVPCTKEELNKFMMTYPPFENGTPHLDGLLFYHKKAHYTSGQTPLVGWLYPYMVPEVLGEDITVHKSYLAQKPANYVDQSTFIRAFDAKLASKSCWRNKSNSSMDTSSATSETESATSPINRAGDAMTPDMIDRTPEMEADGIPESVASGSGDTNTSTMEAEKSPDTTVKCTNGTKSPTMEADESSVTTVNDTADTKPEVEAEVVPDTVTDSGEINP